MSGKKNPSSDDQSGTLHGSRDKLTMFARYAFRPQENSPYFKVHDEDMSTPDDMEVEMKETHTQGGKAKQDILMD